MQDQGEGQLLVRVNTPVQTEQRLTVYIPKKLI